MALDNSHSPAPPDSNPETNHIEDEIDIIDLIRPLWQQKIMIVAITFAIIAVAVIMVLRATPQYKIYTQLKPGICRWDKDGTPSPFMKTIDLKNLLASGIFDTYTEQSGFKENAPKISVTSARNGDQLTAAIFWPDPAEGKKILAGYIKFLNKTDRNDSSSHPSGLQNQRSTLQKSIEKTKADIEAVHLEQQTIALTIEQKKEGLKLIDLQKDRLTRKIESINADLNLTKKELNFLNEHIKVTDDTRLGYEKSRQDININTSKIISLRDKLLQTPPSDSLQLLLLASTIQQNIAYLSTIDQKIEAARKTVISYHTKMAGILKSQEKYHLSIVDLQAKIALEIPKQKSDAEKEIIKLQWRIDKKIPNKIALLQRKIDGFNEKIKTITLVETVEHPQSSTKPVKPNKKKIVALAGVMGGFLAIICAYGRNFWLNNRQKLLE
ncbi:MAG: hypothetical protein KAH06_06355 [Desulfobacterales bacterium]|nr:hypothetical protein [Desulfobacterales bacterium]